MFMKIATVINFHGTYRELDVTLLSDFRDGRMWNHKTPPEDMIGQNSEPQLHHLNRAPSKLGMSSFD